MITMQLPDNDLNEVLKNEKLCQKSASSSTISTVTSTDDLITSNNELMTPIENTLCINIRKDVYGNEIKKGGKHRVTFIDKVRNKNTNEKTLFKGSLKDIVLVESYKKYNIIKTEESDDIVELVDKDDGASGKSCSIF
jgi:hypothetical protein